MAPPSMENHLLWYLEKFLSLNGSITEPWESEHHLPWNRGTCLFVLAYIVQFCSELDHCESSDAITALDEIAKCIHELYIKQQDNNGGGGGDDDDNGGEEFSKKTQNKEDYLDEINKKQKEFSNLLVNYFVPDVVPRFFTVPTLKQSADKDKHLKPNEIFAGFMDFLLQVLHHEANISEDEDQRYGISLVQKEISFLLLVLGDVPIHSSDHELVEGMETLMVELAILANEAGMLVYDRVFHIQQNSDIHASMKVFDSEVSFRSGSYRKKLELGYKRLPHYMKPCSLYIATLPKDVEISKEQLAWMWITEDCSISEMSNLWSISFVCIYKQKEEEILRHLPHLQKLKCICGGPEGDVIYPDISFLTELETLKICIEVGKRVNILTNLNFSFRMKKLCLSGVVLTVENISMIGELPKLEVLKLEKHTFVSNMWIEWRSQFEKLRFLKIEARDLMRWVCSILSFGRLECLVVTGCSKLEQIPISFGHIHTLERIEVMKCGPGLYLTLAGLKYNLRGVDIVTDKNLEQMLLQDIELHDEKALTERPSMKHLSQYLKEHVPQHWDTCIFVIDSVMQLHSNPDHQEFHDVVMGLDRIAQSYTQRKERLRHYSCWSYETEKKQGEFCELFVNSFILEVQKFFKVLKLDQLSDKDKHLTAYEILAAFLNFLIQVLHREENISWCWEQLYGLLRDQLSFYLAVLGDISLQPTHPWLEEQVNNNLLEEFELMANEAGNFIHSCLFSIHPIDADWLFSETVNLLVNAELLNANIEHHCNKFSELPMPVVQRYVVDSFFIFDSLIEDIENLENCEINITDEDEKRSQIGILKDELNISKSIIKVSDQIPRGADANKQKEALIQIRDLAYQAEYLINSHVVGNIPAWYLNLRLPSIVQEIMFVNRTLQHVEKMQDSYDMYASGGDSSSRTRENPAMMDDNDLLTFKDNGEKIILEDLFRRSVVSRQIISISGMPGLGKTTTATRLYNCPKSSEYFDRRAWCVVSQEYSLRALFVQILRDIAPEKSVFEKENAELGVSIHKCLHKRRYLIVLDDVWDSDVLEKMILRYLPDDCNGSRVIVTSRRKDVAPDNSIFHTLFLLSNDQCWDLLKKKVFPNPGDLCPSKLDDIGKQIAEKCCGLPLAVVTTAGILANLETERSVWEIVGKQLDGLLLDGQSNYRKILEISYENLPHSMKPCFLYFATFPEDAEISKTELTWLWIAEGYIPKEEKESPEEIAEMYFVDLINRSLVMPEKRGSDGRIRTCRIHDLLHDICVAKAHEENFIKSTKVFSMYEKHQHLCLPSESDTGLRPFGLHCRSLSHCRSLRDCYTYESSYLRTMALLKTVNLLPHSSYVESDMCPRLDLPVQLRYLGIGDLQKRIMANLVNLEFIHVRNYRTIIRIPSVILRMVKLRHLFIRNNGEFEEDCSSDMTETTNLRSLSKVLIKGTKDNDILRHSPHLKKLKCKCGGEALFPDLSALAELQSLRVDYEYNFSGEISLSEISFPSTLKKLCLSSSRLPWEKMSIIGQLPKLEVLKLENNAFVGEEWKTNDDEFQELRCLKIKWMDLKQWRSESYHFPILEQLLIHYCRQLEEIPTDLGYIQSLQRIELCGCGKGANSSADEIKEEQYENGNTQLEVYVQSVKDYKNISYDYEVPLSSEN